MSKSDRHIARKIISDELVRMAKPGAISMLRAGHRENMTAKKSDQKLALSDYELALISESADVPGRLSDERAARLLADVVIAVAPVQWSIHHVRVRLKEAARGCEKIVSKVGPGTDRGFWPATITEWADKVSRAGHGSLLLEPCGAGDDHDVARIEEAIHWPARYLRASVYDAPRMALHCWLWCEAVGQPFEEYFRSLGCSRRTSYRRVDAAVRKILDGVILDGIDP